MASMFRTYNNHTFDVAELRGIELNIYDDGDSTMYDVLLYYKNISDPELISCKSKDDATKLFNNLNSLLSSYEIIL